jgi:hypothetical protein
MSKVFVVLSKKFYGPICTATIDLRLRRTLVRLIILIVTHDIHYCHQQSFNLLFQNAAPKGLNKIIIASSSTNMSLLWSYEQFHQSLMKLLKC